MQVLHIINNLSKGGAERILVDLLPLYNPSEIQLSVLQLSDQDSEPEYLRMLQQQGIPCTSLSDKSIYNPLLIFKLIRYISSGKYNVIHVHLFPSFYWVAIASLFCKNKAALVFTEHSTQNKRHDKVYFKPIDKFIYNVYDKIIAISPKIKEQLIASTGAGDKIQVLQNGVDTSLFKQTQPYSSDFFLQEFGIPHNSIKLMMTARFSYPKDHKTLMLGFSQLPTEYYLILVGEGSKKEEMIAYAHELHISNRVIFAGFRSDVPALMKSMDLNILSSEYEGMSGVTLEALAAGVPFLGTDVLGINDIVPDDRYLFKFGSATQLKSKIGSIMADSALRTSMILEGLAKAEELDIYRTIKNHKSLYATVESSYADA